MSTQPKSKKPQQKPEFATKAAAGKKSKTEPPAKAKSDKNNKNDKKSDDMSAPGLERQSSNEYGEWYHSVPDSDVWGEEDPDDPWGDKKEGKEKASADDGWGDDDDGGGEGDGGWDDDVSGGSSEPTSGGSKASRTVFKILDSKHVSERRDKCIAENAELLGLSLGEMDLLLRYLRYDKKRIDAFLNDSKTNKEVRLQSGIRGEAKKAKKPTSKTVECAAWCSTVPIEEAHALTCGHYLCFDCWKAFLKSEVNAGIATVFSKCPAQDDKGKKCQEPVDYATMKKFLDPADLKKLDVWILDQFVDSSKNIKWCPKADCGLAIEYDGGDSCDIFCKCSTSFCFQCLAPAHSPAPCDLTAKWLQLNDNDEAASERLIQSLTKPCPKCNTRIEKNRHCNHMKCTKCAFDFCWQCMQAITIGTTHPSWYVCKNREKAQAEGKLDQQEAERLKLTEFLTKLGWHKQHVEDCQKDKKASQALLKKVAQAELKMTDGRTLNWLQDIVKQIAEAHRFLEWSFVYTYFMADNARKETFVNWQKILEEKADGMLHDLEKALADVDNFPKYLEKEVKRITEIKKSTEVLSTKMKQMGELADEIAASLQHEADRHSEFWTCIRCTKSSPDVEKGSTKKTIACTSCGACRAHGDLDCLVVTCKKT